jgi:para-nitrobenzyl esterase
MKEVVRSICSCWLGLAFALQPAAAGNEATDSQTPALSQSLIGTAASALPTHESPVARTTNGLLSGKMEDGVAVFRGIPFAAPPVGRLRWRAPEPAPSWKGVRRADQNGNSCIQPKAPGLEMGGLGALSEDCLYLNVWTAGIDPSAKRPVIVWIHGGALRVGSGSLDLYDGSPLAKKGAVVVTLNYRLGALGFFSHPALDKESPNGPVNFGLLDQIAALQWVQKNIAAFGGDPENVTVAGESAGAQSVLALMASPLARGLFSQAIAESAYGIASHTRAKARITGINIAKALGLNGPSATAEQLRAVPVEKFIALKGKNMSLAPSLVIGDAVMPQPFLDAFEKGEEAPVPLIIGSNSDEASVATAFGIDPDRVIRSMGLAGVVLKRLYPEVKNNRELGREVIRDLIFATLVRRIADLHSQRAPTWRYYFSYVPADLRAAEPGVPHGGEIVFTLGTADFVPGCKKIFTDADRAMLQGVNVYWFEFLHAGKPQAKGNPVWQNHDEANDRTMELGETIVMRPDFMRHRLNEFIGFLKTMEQILHR